MNPEDRLKEIDPDPEACEHGVDPGDCEVCRAEFEESGGWEAFRKDDSKRTESVTK